MPKRILVILLLSLFFISTVTASEQGFSIVCKDGANFRKEPNGDRICFLDKDTAVFIAGEEIDATGTPWYQVRSLRGQSTITGYLRADMVIPPSQLFQGIERVSAGPYHMLCLNRDGIVQGIGTNHFGVLRIENFTEVRDALAGSCETLMLMQDGSVQLVSDAPRKNNFDMVGPFERIVVGESGFGGIRADGTVTLHFFGFTTPEEKAYLRDLEATLGVVTDLAIGSVVAAGLRSDSTVIFAGDPSYIERFDSVWMTWHDVQQIALSPSCLVALHADGTISVAVNIELRDNYPIDIFANLELASAEDFTGVQQVCASTYYIAVLLQDGTVRITNFPQIDVSDLVDVAQLIPSEQFLAALTLDGRVLMRGDFQFWPQYEAEGMYVTTSK